MIIASVFGLTLSDLVIYIPAGMTILSIAVGVWKLAISFLNIEKSINTMNDHLSKLNGTVADLLSGQIEADKAAEYLRGRMDQTDEIKGT